MFGESSSRTVAVEVKATGQPQWVVGGRTPEASDKPWVFVRLPADSQSAAGVLRANAERLHDLLAPIDVAYYRRYRERYGRESTDIGVVTLTYEQAAPHRGKWEKITELANAVG